MFLEEKSSKDQRPFKAKLAAYSWEAPLNHFLSQPWEKRVLEVGCGVGLHPIQQSQRDPKCAWVAVERTTEKFEKFYRRFLNHQRPSNLFPVHSDAREVARRVSDQIFWDEIYLLYPNPEWKRPQRRWFENFETDCLIRNLKRGGSIVFATNLKEYAQRVIEIVQSRYQWSVNWRHSDEHPWPPRTHFERKYMERGERCFDLLITSHPPGEDL